MTEEAEKKQVQDAFWKELAAFRENLEGPLAEIKGAIQRKDAKIAAENLKKLKERAFFNTPKLETELGVLIEKAEKLF